MKKAFLLITILGLAFSSHAQLLKKIQRKVEDRVEKSVDGILNGQDKENTSSSVVGVSGAATAGPKTSGTFEILTKAEPFVSWIRLLFEYSLDLNSTRLISSLV